MSQDPVYSCANCCIGTENEPMSLCDECMEEPARDADSELLARLARAEAALKRIAEHPHCSYEREAVFNRLPVDRQYEIGVADGHRCAATEARAALAPAPAPAPKEGA